MKCTLVALVFAEKLRTFLLNYIAMYGTLSSIYPSQRPAHLAALIILTGRLSWELLRRRHQNEKTKKVNVVSKDIACHKRKSFS